MPSVVLNRQRWFYETWGTPSAPAVLLLHGFTGSHASLARLAVALASEFFVVAPDLPGHGRTPAPTDARELAMAATADRLSTLLTRLAVGQAFVLGYSMGGRLALHLAVQSPQQVRGLVLESASPGLRDASERLSRRQQDEALANAIERQGIAWFVHYWANQALFQHQSPEVKARENRIRQQQTTFGLAQSLRGAGTGAQASLWEALPHLAMPVLLATGSQDAKFHAIAQDMAGAIPNVQWVSIPDAGHTVHDDNSRAFFKALTAFLRGFTASAKKEGGPLHGI
ncbi:MAG: 2-succinyl-6-hydroxy-2,4-cyclohexadiene-1-carboxylate synthase [Firmicutes bacterium]|nr:2-succinyl-6-hydroxy-2,4-cyclohexadiene-1-carboxylate synthase [Bacillota bacterium]